MTLVTVQEVRALIQTPLSDADLESIIQRVEDEVAARCGPAQDDTGMVEDVRVLPGGGACLFLPSEAGEIVQVAEDGEALDSECYRLEPGGVLRRLPEGARWGHKVEVRYRPADDRAVRKSVILDLIRLELERRGLKAERVGEYAYTALDDYEEERRQILRRLRMGTVT